MQRDINSLLMRNHKSLSLQSARMPVISVDWDTATKSGCTAAPWVHQRPNGKSELYDRKRDPMELRNLIDESSHDAVRNQLQFRLLNHFINTSGVAPRDRDERANPNDPPVPRFENLSERTKAILDR